MAARNTVAQILPINAAETLALAGCYSANVEIKSWTEYRLTNTFAGDKVSVMVLTAKTRAAAIAEAAAVRASYEKFVPLADQPTAMKLRCVTVTERTLEVVSPDTHEDGDGERYDYVTTRLAG